MPTNFIGKLKADLSEALENYKKAVPANKKKALRTIEHFDSLIAQIPSSFKDLSAFDENIFGVIQKVWIYADSIDKDIFNTPKKILVKKIKNILKMPEYSLKSLLKEFMSYAKENESNLQTTNAELTKIKDAIKDKELELAQLKGQKKEIENRGLDVEYKYAMALKEKSEYETRLNDLQEQLNKKNSEIEQYYQEINEKKQLIEKLTKEKKAKYSKQKELVRKIEEITNKTTNKSTNTINFDDDNEGTAVRDKHDSLKEIDMGLEELGKKLRELQLEKVNNSKDITTLTTAIERETSEKKILKENLRLIEKEKLDLEQTKTQLQGELEQLKKHMEELTIERVKVQNSLNTLQKMYEEVTTQKNVLKNDFVLLQTQLNKEIDNKKFLEVKNIDLLRDNKDKEKNLIMEKENVGKLNQKLEEQEKKFKDKLTSQVEKMEKELKQTKKSSRIREQSLTEQVEILKKQNETLESNIAIQEAQKMNSDTQIRLIKRDLEAKAAELEWLRKENELLKREQESAKPQLKLLIQQNEELYNKSLQLESQLDEIKKAKNELESEKKDLNERIKMFQSIPVPQSPTKTGSGKFSFFKQDNSPIAGGSSSSASRLEGP